jgi:hypothetical protein
MVYRLTIQIDTDEPGAAAAILLVKDTLEPVYGWVSTRTVAGWLDEHYDRNHGGDTE